MLKIKLIDKKLKDIKADCELVFVVDKKIDHVFVADKAILEEMGFKGRAEEALMLPEKKRLYVGIDNLGSESLRCAAAEAVRALAKTRFASLKIAQYFDLDAGASAKALAEGFLLGAYRYQKHKSKPDKSHVKEVLIASDNYHGKKFDSKALKIMIAEAGIISECVNAVRDLVNEPPSELTPSRFSAIAKAEAKKLGLGAKILGKKELEKLGMGAFLAVNRASAYPAQLIHLSYEPKNAKKKIMLVGKGLTYDTGGLSLKQSEHMLTMKTDMAGAGAILGVIKAVALLRLPVAVHAIIGATENVIGKDAYKPDDVLRAMNGTTIEVKNTDAEGRLVLADCLCYAQKESADYIVDVATLTGASMVALGEYTSAVMGFNKELNYALLGAAERSGELADDLLFNKYLEKLLKSEIADLSNVSSSRYGGAITAGIFLGEFIEKQNRDKWAHIDIAGPSFKAVAWGVNPAGGSGAGLRLLVEWIKSLI